MDGEFAQVCGVSTGGESREAAASAAQLRMNELTEESLAAFLDAFYVKVRSDPDLGPVFAAAIRDEAWPAHMTRIRDFWSSVMLKSARYKGNPFAAHIDRGVEQPHFKRWLALFDETAAERFMPEIAAALSDRAHRIGASLQSGLFFRPHLMGGAPA